MINTTIVLHTSNKKLYKKPNLYKKNIEIKENQYISFLDEGDEIETIENKQFTMYTKFIDIQKYIHNIMNIPYKYILDIEVYYTFPEIENNIISYRYPYNNRDSINFTSTILETCNECKIENTQNMKMYICILISKENRTISDIINRFLFLENYNYNQDIQENSIRTRNSYFNMIEPTISLYNSHIQPYQNNRDISYSNIFNNMNYSLLEEKSDNSYYNRITNLVNQFVYNRRPNFSSNNVFQNILYLVSYVNDTTEDFLEPVKVTIQENNINNVTREIIKKNITENENIKIENDDTCTICLCDYDNEDIISIINTCNHFFHSNCIKKWLMECNHKCPVCRKSADPSKNE